MAAAKPSAKPAKPMAKSAVYSALAEKTGLSRKQVGDVFDALSEMLKKELGKKGPKVASIAGLLKIKVIHKPKVDARTGINPFTKLEQVFKAKPARDVVKAVPLKALKDMVK